MPVLALYIQFMNEQTVVYCKFLLYSYESTGFFSVVNYQENFELIFILEKVLKTQFEHKTKGSMV